MTSVADRVQQLIEASGATINQAAVGMEIEPSTLFRIATGDRKKPRRPTLQKIADFYKTSVEWLESGSGKPPPVLAMEHDNMIPQAEALRWDATVQRLGVDEELTEWLENLPASPAHIAGQAGFFDAYPHENIYPYPAPEGVEMLRQVHRLTFRAWTEWLLFWIEKVGIEKTRQLLEQHRHTIPSAPALKPKPKKRRSKT